jgi:hypothetical protein
MFTSVLLGGATLACAVPNRIWRMGCWRVGGLALSDRHFMIADVPGYRKAALVLTTTRASIGSRATTLAAPHGLSDAKTHGRRRTWQEVDVLLLTPQVVRTL